ncbi:MAG: isochorismate synthase, partial [Lactococcus lactis]|nr:isochorismate synthase [Lactococcus lactis]
NPNAFIFAYQKGKRIFLGASPEILVQKENDQLLSYALAGTFPKTMENAGQKLLTDPKNLLEHDIVVQKIKRNLLEKAETVTVGTTELMELKNVYHLRTILSAKNSELSLIDWTKQLHPTPALGGEPRHEALEFLRKHENHERGLYAAPLGLIDSKGNGTMIVGIRSALIVDKKLYAYAGCGIIPSSDALEEFRETKVKLKTILEAL